MANLQLPPINILLKQTVYSIQLVRLLCSTLQSIFLRWRLNSRVRRLLALSLLILHQRKLNINMRSEIGLTKVKGCGRRS